MSGYSVFLLFVSYYLLIDIPGLDPTKYRSSGGSVDERSFASLDSQMSDTERFKDASPFLVRCRQCQGELSFAPLNDREVRTPVTLPFS
jgi:DNA polymerase alpha subunit A